VSPPGNKERKAVNRTQETNNRKRKKYKRNKLIKKKGGKKCETLTECSKAII
jgi:hypothetical protein